MTPNIAALRTRDDGQQRGAKNRKEKKSTERDANLSWLAGS